MFKKLKRKFIFTNLLTSTAVLVVAFSAIYLVAASSTNQRVEHQKPFELYSQIENNQSSPSESAQNSQTENAQATSDFTKEMFERLASEREAALNSLAASLFITGLAMEVIVALISIYLAEQSIKPVRDAYLAQKDFIANASHEIKTPLAVIQANLEAADIHGNQWIDNVAKKTEDLANLNNQLLALARSESVSEEIKLTEVNLGKLVGDIINEFSAKATEQGIKLKKSEAQKLSEKVKLNRQAFEQILNIYADNGIKYGKKEVEFEIKKDRVLVKSDGTPMDKAKIPHLFDRFYQSDKTSDGVGLGLAIAKTIANKNGWKVFAYVDKENKKNVFVLQFT